MILEPEIPEYIETEYLERLISCLEDNNIDDEPFIQQVNKADKSTVEAFKKLFKEIHETLEKDYQVCDMFIDDNTFNNLLESLKEG